MYLTEAATLQALLAEVDAYINENYIEQSRLNLYESKFNGLRVCEETKLVDATLKTSDETLALNLPEFESIGESFQEALFRIIDERNLKETDVYKDANMDRKLFSKIRGNKQYQPKKSTALALAIALKLGLEETEDFIKTAGFAFSNSSKFDLIIKYFINQREYDIVKINQVLFKYNQILL